MKKTEFPKTNLIKLNIEKIKNNLLHSISWDDIIEIKKYCEELLEHHDDYTEVFITKNQVINQLIESLKNMKD